MENKINKITKKKISFAKWKLREGEHLSESELFFCQYNPKYFENIKFVKRKELKNGRRSNFKR